MNDTSPPADAAPAAPAPAAPEPAATAPPAPRPWPLLVLGVLTIVFGFVAIGAPLMTGTAATMVIGAALLVSGILEFAHAFRADGWRAGAMAFLVGGLSILGGGLILARPLFGLAALTLILAAYFLVDGIVRTILAFKLKPLDGWGWVLFGGIISILLGLMIWRQWPVSGIWAVGVLVGIRILFAGWTMLFLGIGIKAVSKASEPA